MSSSHYYVIVTTPAHTFQTSFETRREALGHLLRWGVRFHTARWLTDAARNSPNPTVIINHVIFTVTRY